MEREQLLFDFCQRYGDDRLILGQQLSEWCGIGPTLEEDIALSNVALDCIGQANLWLDAAGKFEGAGRDADKLAYFRDEREFRCCLLAQQPNGDFAQTTARHFFYDAFAVPFLTALADSSVKEISDIARTSLKEAKYHLRRSAGWVVRLGDGTEESKQRMQQGIDLMYPFVGELFELDDNYAALFSESLVPDLRTVRTQFEKTVTEAIHEATLTLSDQSSLRAGGRQGVHSEYLGHLLAEMQSLARAHPDATW